MLPLLIIVDFGRQKVVIRMDGFDSVWQVFIISLIAGALIGVLIYRILDPSHKQINQLKAERDSANQELDSYKAGVSQHFDKTSELVNDLTENYVKVYQHLAEGAHTLGAGKSFNNLLEQNHGKVSLAVEDKSIVDEVVTPVDVDREVQDPLEASVSSDEIHEDSEESFTDSDYDTSENSISGCKNLDNKDDSPKSR